MFFLYVDYVIYIYFFIKEKMMVVWDIYFNVEKGDFILFFGLSGCGKIILFFIIVGLIEFLEGRVLIEGCELN